MRPLEHLKQIITSSIEAKHEFYKANAELVVSVAQTLGKTILQGGKILIFGNGGSAADAQHMAAEMVGRMLVSRKKPLPALALSTDTSCLTAIANDFSYEDVFLFQVQALGRRGDVAIAISTSGNSKNVLRAAEYCRSHGIYLVSFTGGTGGKLKGLSDVNLNVALGKNSSMIQETHISIVHGIVDLMDRFFLNEDYV